MNYAISNIFIKKQRPWMKKWIVDYNRTVKEVKEVLVQKGLNIRTRN